MAARRLLIVMLVLLGLSTLAAALVPQHALRGGSTGSTTTQSAQSTTTPSPAAGRSLSARIKIGGKKIPVVAGPVCVGGKCGKPIHVGDQLSLEVFARKQTELEIRSFGLIGVASKTAPALFQLLFNEPTNIGVVSTATDQPVAKIEVLSAKAAAKAAREQRAKKKGKGGSKDRARAE
jgi:hypothetical protein